MFVIILAACTIQPRGAEPAEIVLDAGAARLRLPAGAVDEGVEIRLTAIGDASELGLELDGPPHSAIWAIEPVGTVLRQPAILEIDVGSATDSVIYAASNGTYAAVPTETSGGIAATTITTLSQYFAGAPISIIVPIDTANPTPPPTPPPAPSMRPPLASHPSPGDIWSCGTGIDDVIDLSDFDDTANPTHATVPSCGPGVAAHQDGVAFADLHTALITASAGSLVEVCPGVHEGRFDVPDGVTVRGHADDPSATILTSALTGRVLQPQGSLTLERLTIRRGYDGYDGGGLSTRDPLVAHDTRWEQNVSCYEGGAVNALGPVRIDGSAFEGNLSGSAAGAANVGIRRDPADIEIRGSTFTGNSAGYSGGAVTVDGNGGEIHIVDCTFDGNTAGYEGGAIANGSWDSHLLAIDGSTFTQNHAGYQAGALDAATWSPDDLVEVNDCVFTDNTAPSGSAVEISHHEGGTYTFTGTTIQGAGDCLVEVSGTLGWGSPFVVDFFDATIDPSQICTGNRAEVAIDGTPLP